MKNLKLILILMFIFAGLSSAANAQITSVSQLKDVRQTDEYYPALKNLIENYNAIDAYPDNTFRANQPLKRGEFAVILDFALNKMLQFGRKSDPEIVGTYVTKWVYGGEDAKSMISEVKDVKPGDKYYAVTRDLIETWFIDLSNKGYLSPDETISERDFYNCLFTVFKADPTAVVYKNYSPAKIVSRGIGIIEMSKFLDELRDEKFPEMVSSNASQEASNDITVNNSNAVQQPKPSVSSESSKKLEIIKNLPSKGKAVISKGLHFYVPDSPCADLSGASADIKTAFAGGGIWGEYRINKGDEGDIVYETNNTCEKGRIILLRVGTAIVTMMEKGIKRLN